MIRVGNYKFSPQAEAIIQVSESAVQSVLDAQLIQTSEDAARFTCTAATTIAFYLAVKKIEAHARPIFDHIRPTAIGELRRIAAEINRVADGLESLTPVNDQF